MLTITSPEPGFSGEVAGVIFAKGEATLDAAVHVAALAYFRRRGYLVAEVESEQVGEASVVVEPAAPEPVEPESTPEHAPTEPAEAFDPADHNVVDVVAYLADADEDERARVLAAEAAGEARATILKKGQGQ